MKKTDRAHAKRKRMKTRLGAPLLAANCLLTGVEVHAEELRGILNQISSDLETRKTSEPSPKGKNPVAEKPSQPENPKIIIRRARDTLPKEFRGHGLVGRFRIASTNRMENPTIISAEDFNNPFARQFCIVNANAGLGSGRIFIGKDRPAIQFTERKSLIFAGIFMHGVYNVKLS